MARARRSQRGMSLVELMVGVTIGLIVVAGATTLAATQLIENRRLLVETQVQQDLRASLDIITRDLRRAGHSVDVLKTIWRPDAPGTQPVENAFSGVVLGVAGEVVAYKYWRPAAGADSFGYGLNSGTITSRIGVAGTPQALTDRNTLNVTAFTVTPVAVSTAQLACPKLCPDGTQACWPTASLNALVVSITGQAVSDTNIVRTVSSQVRLRNDGVEFNTATPQVCPP